MRRTINVLLLILYIELFVFFCYQSSKSGEASSGISLVFAEAVKNIFHLNTDIDIIHTIIRKLIGHFSYFGLFSISSYLFYNIFKKKWPFIFHFTVGMILALISEFVFEANAVERGPSMKDCLIDYSGFLVGTLCCFIISLIIKKCRKSN